jgi:phosphatidylethanolamine/phosphatidyl-N-methylethanolamine N-methyltransferase
VARYPSAEQVAYESRRVERVYGVLARVYDDFFDWALGPGRRCAVARLPVSPGQSVLEVGVGTGLSLPLYPARCRVVGIDISDAMMQRARLRMQELAGPTVELRKMDAQNLTFEDQSFDHVLAPYVVSVVPDPSRVMAEMRRVCAVGGTVVVVNHFRSSNRLLGWVETLLTPLTAWLGFRMDLPLETVTRVEGLEVVRIERVNLLGLWRLIVLRRVL